MKTCINFKDKLFLQFERRRLASPGSAAEASAVKDVRDQAIAVAVAAAKEVVAKTMTEEDNSKLIDDSIAQVDAKLH